MCLSTHQVLQQVMNQISDNIPPDSFELKLMCPVGWYAGVFEWQI